MKAVQRGRRGDPNYTQITALVPKDIGLEFKAECTRSEVSISEAVEEMIRQRQGRKEVSSTSTTDALRSVIERLWNREQVSDPELSEVAYDFDLEVEALHKIKECLSKRKNGNAHVHKS